MSSAIQYSWQPGIHDPNALAAGTSGERGSAQIFFFCDTGDPNLRSDPEGILVSCGLGSTYSRIDVPQFYLKVGGTNPNIGARGWWKALGVNEGQTIT